MFLRCKVCEAKDQHIADLKDQLAKVTSMVNHVVSPQYPKLIEAEMNYALDGANKEQLPAPTEEQLNTASAVEREAIELFTGTYS